ncbi:MAG: alpha-amylase [bacterium]|nr:alpha-amylase [bacterium]
MQLLLSRGARSALQLGPPLAEPSERGSRSLSASFREARGLAERLTPLLPPDTRRFSAGELYALGRIERALHAYLDRFLRERDPEIFVTALADLDRRFGMETINRLLGSFEDEYLPDRPGPIALDRFESTAGDLGLASDRRQELLAGLLVFSIAHTNPANSRLNHLFHFGALVADAAYDSVIHALTEVLARAPGLYEDDQSLIMGLRRPIDSEPDSLANQLRWITKHWNDISPELEPELLAALDLIAEEEKPRLPPGPGPIEAPFLAHLDSADVRYGSDRSWMSNLVLAAKNAHVWLHQLSSRHGCEIDRLDQIPDAELETLAQRGVTGLWLIGLWERSRASQRIKQLCGNPEAAGSAYSLIGYRIADDLGGDAALEGLAKQAGRFGIRLSADMVPNHTGIDSDWMIEHPEYFLSVPDCPFPAYSFDGPDLSRDHRVGIFLEDHYYDRSDAAVVFKRVDNQTGVVRFIYHGNDGTSTPWNDTAQLDYLNPDTREAVANTILDVARRFPIIRFDAAMTLARRHIQRLWYPEPGTAGAIPSRAEHAMSTSKFNSLMPHEFWRDVVDRAEKETPDTLLLAEAFWLMEGYFVRNLGLHRVYNSAFMNMLRDGDNRGYRRLVRESLDFDAEILRRYVNFLSNPDEETAIEQFGDGDRYFGACVMLATMPGLPMLAHGQIEGLTERYGMEYRRAYVDESPNQGLVERHEREIFPLLRERARFADVESFAMHDFVGQAGAVDENVLAFSHGVGGDTSIVVFNNQYETVRGALRLDRNLGISGSAHRICGFRDRLSGHHFLRAASAVHDLGLELELAGYESAVLVDFRELDDRADVYVRLQERVGLRGIPSIEQAVQETELEDARTAFAEVLATICVAGDMSGPALLALENQLEELDRQLGGLLEARPEAEVSEGPEGSGGLDAWLEGISRLAVVEEELDWPGTERMRGALERLLTGVEWEAEARFALSAFALLGYLHHRWGRSALVALDPVRAASRALDKVDISDERARELTTLVEVAAVEDWLETAPPPGREAACGLLAGARESDAVAHLLGYDRETDTAAVEQLDRFLAWRATAAALSWLASGEATPSLGQVAEAVVGWCDVLDRLRLAVAKTGHRIEPVLERLRGGSQPEM